jgi:hypothetical protein
MEESELFHKKNNPEYTMKNVILYIFSEKTKELNKVNTIPSTMLKGDKHVLISELLFSVINFCQNLPLLFSSPLFYPLFLLLLNFREGREFIMKLKSCLIMLNNKNIIFPSLIDPMLNLIPFAILNSGELEVLDKGDNIYCISPQDYEEIL